MARRRRNRKWLWIVWIVILVALVAVVFVAVLKREDGNKVEEKTETAAMEIEEKIAEMSEEELASAGVEKVQKVQYDGEDPNTLEELTGVVSYAGVNDGVLMIRTSIDQYLASGSCELTLVRGGDTIYNSIANIIGDASTAACQGFDVPVAGLGGGNIQIIINLSADGKTGTLRGEVEI